MGCQNRGSLNYIREHCRAFKRRLFSRPITALILLLISLSGCREQIIHNLEESDANRIIARLQDSSLEAEKTKQPDGKWSIAVDKSQTIQAIKLLSDARMLRDESSPQNDSSPLLASREDQRFRFERALSSELERSLTGIGGVLEARVHLNLPETDPILGYRLSASKGSASVLLITNEKFNILPDEIKSMISGASGVSREAISVLLNRDLGMEKPAGSAQTLPQARIVTLRENGNWQGLATVFGALLTAGILFFVVSALKRRRAIRYLYSSHDKENGGNASNDLVM